MSSSSNITLPREPQSQEDLNMQYHHQLALQQNPVSLNSPMVQNYVYPVAGYPGQLFTGFENLQPEANLNLQTASVRNVIEEKPKRTRLAYSDYQRQVLSEEFAKNQYITHEQRKQLSITLGIPERNIKVWFQNRRQDRKKLLEVESNRTIDHMECSYFGEATQMHTFPPNGTYNGSSASEQVRQGLQHSAQYPSQAGFLCEANEMVSTAPVDRLQNGNLSMAGAINQFDVHSDQHGISSTSDAASKLNIFDMINNETTKADVQKDDSEFCLGDYINIDDATM